GNDEKNIDTNKAARYKVGKCVKQDYCGYSNCPKSINVRSVFKMMRQHWCKSRWKWHKLCHLFFVGWCPEEGGLKGSKAKEPSSSE
ncbi:MAG TPA: hypothetical protein VL968_00670, partial [Rhodocyclaceae bacterium]|nr:hypothetical protein [Rhodocyclaceae bacterium]